VSHSDLASYIHRFSYPGIFLWFAAGEQLTPIPEEVSLISAGYITKYVSLNPFIVGLLALLGLLATDSFLFFISRKGSRLSGKLLKNINSSLLSKVRRNLKKNAAKTLTIMALLPKLRFISPLIAGAAGISWKIFLLINSIATAFYVTLYMLLGIFFYRQLSVLLRKLAPLHHVIFIAFMVILAAFIFLMVKKSLVKSK
jgi:membrane protein DedA with SNARE-associated domain